MFRLNVYLVDKFPFFNSSGLHDRGLLVENISLFKTTPPFFAVNTLLTRELLPVREIMLHSQSVHWKGFALTPLRFFSRGKKLIAPPPRRELFTSSENESPDQETKPRVSIPRPPPLGSEKALLVLRPLRRRRREAPHNVNGPPGLRRAEESCILETHRQSDILPHYTISYKFKDPTWAPFLHLEAFHPAALETRARHIAWALRHLSSFRRSK